VTTVQRIRMSNTSKSWKKWSWGGDTSLRKYVRSMKINWKP